MQFLLKEIFAKAHDADYAIGHFNFCDSVVMRAVVEVCQELKSPVFVGTSEGEAKFLGYHQAVALRDAWRKETGLPVFLNADHHKSFERAKEAIDAGYDSVQLDGTEISLEENIALTKKVVEYARSVNPEISVEGEIGYIRGSSELIKSVVEIKPEDMTSPEEAKRFVEETGVDRFAVVIGNIHGITLNGNPKLNIERLKEIRDAIPAMPLTLHGGSGIADADIKATLSIGMSNIHINTDIRVAFARALQSTWNKDPDLTTPYKFFAPSAEAAKEVIRERLRVFGAVDVL